jgi:hypothetical protein
MKQIPLLILVLLQTTLVYSINSKTPALEQIVSVDFDNEQVSVILTSLSQQSNVVFSYSTEVLAPGTRATLHVKNKPIRTALNTLFGGTVKYKQKGKYIILLKEKAREPSTNKKNKQVYEGYISESRSGKKISNATVYDKDLMVSVVTDEYGYFKIELPPSPQPPKLQVSKAGYSDTLILPVNTKTEYIDVELPTEDNKKVDFDSIFNFRLPIMLLSEKLLANTQNLKDSFFLSSQVSLLPFVGTNSFLSSNTVNDYSFNILAGYVQEVRKLELGGVLNIVRQKSSGVQLSGVGNITGQSVDGFQGAGVFNATQNVDGVQSAGTLNVVLNNFHGAQFAGSVNIVGNTMQGFQGSGVLNIARTMKGLQATSSLNICGELDGLQLVGVANVAVKPVKGSQLAGVANFAIDSITGTQIAGVMNVSGIHKNVQLAGVMNVSQNISGLQMSSLLNIANRSEGAQISSLLNIASEAKGIQLALVNFADTCSGLPVGFLSVVKRGYHKLEISTNDMLFSTFAFRTGVKYFHNIFIIGVRNDNAQVPLWNYGYGLGTSIGKGKMLFDFDVFGNQYISGDNFTFNNFSSTLYLGADIHIYKSMSIAAGFTYNYLYTNTKDADYENIFSKLSTHYINQTTRGSVNLKQWLGWRIAIRFF